MSRGKCKMSGQQGGNPQDLASGPVENPFGPPSAGPTPIQVHGFVQGGRGIGRQAGRVWMVEGAVPGDTVVAEPVRVRPRLVEARIVRLVHPSPDRRTPPCPYQGTCGGCPWMVVPESVQRSWKRRLLEEALRRIGGFDTLPVDEVVPSPLDFGYRNKVEFSLGRDREGRRALGLHGVGPEASLVDLDACLLQDEAANRVLATAREFFLQGPGREDPALEDPREPARLVIRHSALTGRVLVALRGASGPFQSAAPFAEALIGRHPEIQGVVRLVALPGRRGGVRTVALVGEPWIEEVLGGTVFRLPAASFFQVNPWAAEKLVGTVVEHTGPREGESVLDLYGGVGVFALALARRGARATVVEADPEAVACGREAAAREVAGRVQFRVGDVEAFLRSEVGRLPRPDAVVVDPPRRGLGRRAVAALAALGARRIVMVSCEATTLARDLKLLAERGYRPERVTPIDLFPQTPHLEMVVTLARS